MNERTTRGDIPLNMNASGQITHAYMYSGDESLKNWVTEYLSVWHERAKANGGVTPDNVGLSGEIGEYNEGKWWGDHYGWRWPHGFFTIIEPILNICLNAYLITGDESQLTMARSSSFKNESSPPLRGSMSITKNPDGFANTPML